MSYVAKQQPLSGWWSDLKNFGLTIAGFQSGTTQAVTASSKNIDEDSGGAVEAMTQSYLEAQQKALAQAEAERIAKEKAEKEAAQPPPDQGVSTLKIVAVGAAVWFLFLKKKR